MRRKIAPRLEELVDLEQGYRLYLLPTHSAQAARELRALLAVARAAEAFHANRDLHQAERLSLALGRALARLAPPGSEKG